MSANRIKTDDRYFVQRFRHELRRVAKSMSGIYKLARERGITSKDNVTFNLFSELSKASGLYIGYKYGYLDNVLQLREEFKDKKKNTSKMGAKKDQAEREFRAAMNGKISNRVQWPITVSITTDKCGVLFEGSHIKMITVPIMYSNHNKAIGSLGSNKVLVWAKPHKHDAYKCWKACFFTFGYSNGIKRYKSVDCYIMKDDNSGIVYYHTDYKLCASGMRRAIGRHISKRIGGA